MPVLLKRLFLCLLPVLALTVALSGPLIAQAVQQPIKMEKKFGGVKFWQDGKYLKPKEVLHMMETNQAAYDAFKKAKSNLDVASVVGFAGGFMVGWPLGAAVAGGEPQWGLAGAGAAVILLSIPFSSAFKKHATRAVEIYNGEGDAAYAHPMSIHCMPAGAGVRVVIRW